MTEEELERLKGGLAELAGRAGDTTTLHAADEDLAAAKVESQDAKAKVSAVVAKKTP